MQDRMPSIEVLLVALAVVLASGCATTSRTATLPSGETFSCNTEASRLFERLGIMGQIESRGDALDLLLLSGGGAHGAWGAGFLKGWGSSGAADDTAMPTFDLVTGVSTGALQSTHAFLGDYDTLYEIYTTIENDEVFRKRSWLTVPFSNSLLKSAPLSDYIDSLITEDVLERVHAQGEDRLLCVGNVDLHTGRFREWDMTAIAAAFVEAAGDADRRAELLNLYQTVLVGSAAIPVAFPPVAITEDTETSLYVDGGTRQNVFIAFGNVLDFSVAPLPALRGLAGSRGPRLVDNLPVRIHVVVNGQLGIAPATVRNRLIPIATRSLSAVMAQLSNGAVYQIAWELDRRNAAAAGIETRFTFIPGDRCLSFTSLDFDPVEMKALADDAFELGRRYTWFEFDPDSSLEHCDAAALQH